MALNSNENGKDRTNGLRSIAQITVQRIYPLNRDLTNLTRVDVPKSLCGSCYISRSHFLPLRVCSQMRMPRAIMPSMANPVANTSIVLFV